MLSQCFHTVANSEYEYTNYSQPTWPLRVKVKANIKKPDSIRADLVGLVTGETHPVDRRA